MPTAGGNLARPPQAKAPAVAYRFARANASASALLAGAAACFAAAFVGRDAPPPRGGTDP